MNPTKILGSLRHTWPVFTTLPTLNPCCDCLCCYKHVPHLKLISERVGVMLTTRGTLQLQLLYCWTVNKDAPHKQDGDESTPGQTPLPPYVPPCSTVIITLVVNAHHMKAHISKKHNKQDDDDEGTPGQTRCSPLLCNCRPLHRRIEPQQPHSHYSSMQAAYVINTK